MKNAFRRKFIVLGLSLGIAAIAGGISGTLAAFQASGKVDQMAGYQGLRPQTILLDTYDGGTWNQPSTNWDFGLDTGTYATYYMYAFDSADSSINKWIAATLVTPASTSNVYNHHILAFQFDTLTYNSFNFVRFNPNGTSVPSWDRDGNNLWDQTSAQTYSADYNYYGVDTSQRVENGDGFGHDTAKVVTWKKATVVDGVLTVPE